MSDGFDINVLGGAALQAALLSLAPELRRGPAQRALRKGAAPVLAAAYAATPILAADVYRRGKLYRTRGTLRNALKIRASRDVNKTGDVGVFVNVKPLTKGAISDFKAATGRPGSQNPRDPFYWRWVTFATRKNKNPAKFLQKGGAVLETASVPLIAASLKGFFDLINKRKAAP